MATWMPRSSGSEAAGAGAAASAGAAAGGDAASAGAPSSPGGVREGEEPHSPDGVRERERERGTGGGRESAPGKSCDVGGDTETVGNLVGLLWQRRRLQLPPLLPPPLPLPLMWLLSPASAASTALLLLRDLRTKRELFALANGLGSGVRGERGVTASNDPRLKAILAGGRSDVGNGEGATGTDAPSALMGLHDGHALPDLMLPQRAHRMTPGGSLAAADPTIDHEKTGGAMVYVSDPLANGRCSRFVAD